MDGQERSTRTLLVALVGGLAVLAIGAYFGLRALRPGDEAEGRMTAGVRTYLAAGRPGDAMAALELFTATHGRSADLDRLRTEIATSIWAAAKTAADDASRALASGNAAPAGRLEEPRFAASPGPSVDADAVRASIRRLKTRAAALDRAKERLESGDVLEARKAALEAAGSLPPTGELHALIAKADALDASRSMLGFAEASAQAPSVVSRITTAYGDDTTDRAALEVLRQALGLELGALARREGRKTALARREELRLRLRNFTAWASVDREIDLGSLWEYAGAKRAAWRDGDDDLTRLTLDLSEAGAKDPELLYRYALTLHGVQRARNEIGVLGMRELEAAAGADPSLLERHDAELRGVVEDWLAEEQEPHSLGRRLAVARWFEALRPKLVAGLTATSGEGADARPDVATRANSFAILADRGEPLVVRDRLLFLSDMLPAFVEGSTPQLSHAEARALFRGAMDALEFARLRARLEGEVERARGGEGPYGASTDAKANLAALVEDLLVAQPDLAKSAK